MGLSSRWPVKALCLEMPVSRSGFYKWKARLSKPCPRAAERMSGVALFEECHKEHPSHGCRWLSAKTMLDYGIAMPDQCAHRCCKFAGIRSRSKRYAYKKPGEERRVYPNLVMASMKLDGPMRAVASDMTAFWAGGKYRGLALYMGLWGNEIVGCPLSSRGGDRRTYFEGPEMAAEKKKGMDGLDLILHAGQGSVYSSKSFNELLPQYHITHSMPRAGTPTDNGAMEAINGWAKPGLFLDFRVGQSDDVPKAIESYIEYFNEGRPSYALGYLTPKAFREMRAGKPGQPKKPSRIAYEKKQAAIAKAKAENEEKERRLKEEK